MGQGYIEAEYKDPGYAAAKQRSIDKTTGVYDAAIADASNKSAQAGAVQGVGNAGRLAADTYAKVSNEKNRRISAIEDQYNNYELQHKAAFNNQQAWSKQQYEMNKPGFLDYLGFGVNLASGVASIPGVVSGIGKLFGAGDSGSTPTQTDTKGTPGLGINKDINNMQDLEKATTPRHISEVFGPTNPLWKPPPLKVDSGTSGIQNWGVAKDFLPKAPKKSPWTNGLTKNGVKPFDWLSTGIYKYGD